MADDNWKKRLGIEINYSSEDDDDSRRRHDDSPLSPGVDDLLVDYDHLGSTPPRTRIRIKDKSRRENYQREAKSSPRTIYGGRSSSEKNFYNRSTSANSFEDEVDNIVERRPGYSKRTMQRLRGSERDLKLDLSDIQTPTLTRDDRAESLPPQSAFKICGLQVESCNRFLSLSSKPVSSRQYRPSSQPAQNIDECSQSRVEFYQTFSMLIKMGNPERQCDVTSCRRQLSREEHMWQNELKDLIWLELQAWHADRTPQHQDQYLCEARESVQPLLLEIISYKFRKRSDPTLSNDSGIHIPVPDSGQCIGDDEEGNCCTCLSMFCPDCMEQQNEALREVEGLMARLQAAEALFPSSKAFASHYPLYMSDTFIARNKAMCVWYNMTKHHRLKLLILGKHLLAHAEKNQCASDMITELSEAFSRSAKCALTTVNEDDSSHDFYNVQPLLRAARYLEQADISHNNNSVFRKYIEDVLKTKGLRKALSFLEKLHMGMLRKASFTLQKPDKDPITVKEGEESFEDQEMRRYGYWSAESQALGLPSYQAAYLFISHIPMDMIHAYLRLRIETKPERPSVMSIRQLIRELKEGLRLAVLNRQRYLDNVNSSLWNCSPEVVESFKSRVTSFDASVQSVLEVYLDYLQHWVQMIQQHRIQKNILKEEWSFISSITRHIPGGQALVGSSFCRMAISMVKINREEFKKQVDELTESIAHVTEAESIIKQKMFSVCRHLQELCVDSREKILNVLHLSKMLRKDLESEAYETNLSSLCCNIIGDSLSQLKREALTMCECISDVVRQIDDASQVPEDWDEGDKDVLHSRIREVLHQYFKFGFEYHKDICGLVTGGSRTQLARGLISFAQLWMAFVKTRYERGRGLRPRWANHGLDFIMTICEPHITNCLTDDEFEELKANIDDCISHVIGTAGVGGGSSPGTPVPYYRGRGISPSPSLTSSRTRPSRLSSAVSNPNSPEIRSEATSSNEATTSNEEKELTGTEDGAVVETLVCPSRTETLRKDCLLQAVQELDNMIEDRLRGENLIGSVVAVKAHQTETNFVRPRTVTFGWQRGIKIGQGRFGKVYTAVNNETGELMAMKEIALQPNDHRTIRNVATELKIFEGIHHENLVRYYGIEIHREEMLIFMELCTEGTLESLVAATESGLPEALIRRYTLQLSRAVSTLHQHAIVHRDIKSANIFLTAEGNCLKLGDFGSAVKIKAHTTVPGELQGFVGTQAYMAPEVFMKSNSDGHGRAVDVWSLGCVLVEMASGKRPWAEFDSNYQIMFKVGMGEIPEIPDTLSEEGRHFASRCLVHDPKLRATTLELLSHTFLAVDGEDECISCTMPSILEDYLKLGIKR